MYVRLGQLGLLPVIASQPFFPSLPGRNNYRDFWRRGVVLWLPHRQLGIVFILSRCRSCSSHPFCPAVGHRRLHGQQKPFMKAFVYLGGLSCIGLFFFTGKNVEWGILVLHAGQHWLRRQCGVL